MDEGTTLPCRLRQLGERSAPWTRLCSECTPSKVILSLWSQRFPNTRRDTLDLDLSLYLAAGRRPLYCPALLVCIDPTVLVSLYIHRVRRGSLTSARFSALVRTPSAWSAHVH